MIDLPLKFVIKPSDPLWKIKNLIVLSKIIQSFTNTERLCKLSMKFGLRYGRQQELSHSFINYLFIWKKKLKQILHFLTCVMFDAHVYHNIWIYLQRKTIYQQTKVSALIFKNNYIIITWTDAMYVIQTKQKQQTR